ncbi:MAG TPA: dTDP-4-dehydrorhamnose reductase [Candidatus Polarisedimenticolia bacterium]|jgi:dTDP-4-dehydrorhamnose reductase|nr:dTDP-4-dehydrorhamnose reductase [Candidatus Polarisedimenticolia bacterium]
MKTRAEFVPMVLGAGGMLGRVLVEVLEEVFPGTISATRAEADVTDRFRLETEIERLRPDAIINCAAYTDVDGCEADPEAARRINVEGAGNAARAAAAAGCRILHVSTDFVFDGRARRPYTEDDPPAPLSEYGRGKLEGEGEVAALAPDHLIVRTAWLYGAGRPNFVDAIRARARNGGTLRVVDDQLGSPTYVLDLARALCRLVDGEVRGLIHFANSGICSRFEMARFILDAGGFRGVALQPIQTAEAGRIAVRPAFSALDATRYTRLAGKAPRTWQEALREYLVATPAGEAHA